MVVSPDRMEEIIAQVTALLDQANEDGSLHGVLCQLGLQGLIDIDEDIDLGCADNATHDILIIGRCELKKNIIQAIAEGMGYSRNRLRFVDYDEVAQFPFSTLRYSSRYAAVMCGPVPHKGGEMGDVSSVLEALRRGENCYPPFVELRESSGQGCLRISKSSFIAGLQDLESRGAIRTDR